MRNILSRLRHAACPTPSGKSSTLAVMFLAGLLLFFPLSSASALSSEVVDLEQSTAQLLVGADSLAAGSEVLVGLEIKLAPDWHTYTYNPGDSGIPTSIKWQLPEGFSVSDIYWPPHVVHNEAGLTTYGFSDEVVLTALLKVPEDIDAASSIKAKAEYLVCKDICIPQIAEFTINIPEGSGAESAEAALLKTWFAKSKLAPANGLIGADADMVAATTPSPAEHSMDETSDTPLLSALLLALLGGIILNLMPCVFPVLSLKALAIAKHAELAASTIRKEGIAYTLGILTCFWVLAALLIGLQHSGEAIGWGFQFQNAGFVACMVVLFVFIGLNLSGIYELPVLFGNLATRLGAADSLKGSYATGLLAALVATPCTAPFMATAIGAALSQPAYIGMLIFTALGLGLALPFLLLSFVPRLLGYLPRPGAWMLTFKYALAFPMYLSAVWLLWVVGTQTGVMGMTLVLSIMVCILFLCWLISLKSRSFFCKIAVGLLILALLNIMAQGLHKLQLVPVVQQQMERAKEQPYTKATLEQLIAENTPVFVDATASWCITCQVNKISALHTEQVQQAFKTEGVVTLVADWTNKDAEVSALLESFGYRGVPLYVYYAPSKAPVVLPQILTPQIILDYLKPSTPQLPKE